MTMNISELHEYIKSLFKELYNLESVKAASQEELFDRIIYLLELYIKQETDIAVQNAMPVIIKKVVDELKESYDGQQQ